MHMQLTWEAEILNDCSFQVMVKKVSPEHRQLLENSSYDRCQKKLILLSARGFTNLFQILVEAKKVKCLNPTLIFHLFLIVLNAILKILVLQFKSPSKKVEQILAFQARCAFQHVTDQFIGPCGPFVRLCGNSYILYAAYQMNFSFRGLWVMCNKDHPCPCEWAYKSDGWNLVQLNQEST